MRPVRILLVYARDPGSATLSYQQGWPRAFLRHPRFRCAAVDLLNRGQRARAMLSLRRVDAVVLLHSVFSNSRHLDGRLFGAIARAGLPTAFFIGNEYKLMPEKMAFCEELGVRLLVSQITSEPALDLYRARLGCTVVGIPNTGVDSELFAPRVPWAERDLDLGYRAYDLPWYVGHRDRRLLADAVLADAPQYGLRLDISLDPDDRLGERDWAGFLNRCRAQLGCEAGTDFFELDDRTRLGVLAYLDEHPGATYEEVNELFFAHYEHPVSGRALSGRVVEAAATGTVQVLLEGEYAGVFRPGEHYLPVRRDLADLDEALVALRDEELCVALAERARGVALAELTYERLVERFYDAFLPVVQ